MAAAAALEVLAQKGVDAFWKMHDLLYEKQKEQGGLERTALEGYAQSLGCDMVKFRKALDDGTHDAEIEADEKAAKDAKLTGTPSFVIGPYELVGAQPKEKFQKLIDRVMHE
jgi:protein-disulfide isomerase